MSTISYGPAIGSWPKTGQPQPECWTEKPLDDDITMVPMQIYGPAEYLGELYYPPGVFEETREIDRIKHAPVESWLRTEPTSSLLLAA